MASILSENELYSVRSDINTIRSQLNEYLNNISIVLSSYKTDPTVETFFASGQFGQAQFDDLLELQQSLEGFINEANDVLIPATLSYVNTQLELVQKGEN